MGSRLWLAAILLCALAGAAAAQPLDKLGDEVAVGRNLTNEDCRLRFAYEQTEQPSFRRYALYCQGWTQPSGEIRRFRSVRNFDPMAAIADGSNYAKAMEARLVQCGPPQPTKLGDGSPAAVRACRARNGGWPMAVVVASVDGNSYYAESLPTNQPVLESSALVLAGKQQPVAQASRTAAIQALEAALGISATQFGVQDVGAVNDLKILGIQYQYRRDFELAVSTQQRALEIIERVFGRNASAAASVLTYIGLAQTSLGLLPDAAQTYARAEPLAKGSPDPRDWCRYLAQSSFLMREQGDHAGSLKRAHDGTACARERKLPAATIGNAIMFEAEALFFSKRYAEAAALGEQGVGELARGHGGYHPEIAITWEWIGFARTENNEPAKAREAFNRSLELRQVMYGGGVPVAESWFGLGRAYRVERNLPASLDAYRKGVQALETDRFGRAALNAPRVASYLESIHQAAQADAANSGTIWREAVRAIQLVRGDVTTGAIRQMATRLAANDPAIGEVAKRLQEQQDRLSRLRADLAREGRRQEAERDAGFEEQVKGEIRAAAQEMEAAERQVQGQYPRYASLVGRNLVGAEELARLLKPDEALLATHVTREATYVVLLRAQGAAGHRAAVRQGDLTELVARVRHGVDWSEEQDRKFDREASQQLHNLLLAPLTAQLQGVKRLVVAPSGPLQSLPFALLASSEGWLAQRFAIATVPSLAAFRDLRHARAPKPAPQPFIGFGDPDFAGAGAGLRNLAALAGACRRGLVQPAELRGLARLAESADELKRIAATLKAPPGSVILGAKATEAAVKSSKLADYRVVMFATHGVLPSEIRCLGEPALALTPPASASARDDGLLNASEVVSLNLNADFVVLSACNTASADGKLSGEALSGLTRAFFYAGARGALVSHWAVASEPTVALTTATFEAYTKDPKAGRAAALQKAQLAMLAKPATAHPVFWAPFVLVGDGS